MADINRDLDRYLQRRKGPGTFAVNLSMGKDSWLSKIGGREEASAPADDLTPEETARLRGMETKIKQEEEKIEAIEEFEEELEEKQEQRVSLYHQVLGLFRKKHREPEVEEVDIPMPTEGESTQDFRRLAQIMLHWLDRLPKRAKDEFLDSSDYDEMTSILERRGVARRR